MAIPQQNKSLLVDGWVDTYCRIMKSSMLVFVEWQPLPSRSPCLRWHLSIATLCRFTIPLTASPHSAPLHSRPKSLFWASIWLVQHVQPPPHLRLFQSQVTFHCRGINTVPSSYRALHAGRDPWLVSSAPSWHHEFFHDLFFLRFPPHHHPCLVYT